MRQAIRIRHSNFGSNQENQTTKPTGRGKRRAGWKCSTRRPNKFSFVIRRLDNSECLGMASLEDADSVSPELGLWLKESAHGQGFGREVVAALVEWGHATLGKRSFIYPVAVQNTASRRIAENLHGEIIGNRTNPKYDSVVYRIPFYESPYPL